MMKKFIGTVGLLSKMYRPLQFKVKPYQTFVYRPAYSFCQQQKGLVASEIPAENLKVTASEATIGEEQVEVFKTKGSVSILDKVPGVKSQDGSLYVLSFTCSKCEAKSIRSFTKHAYHKGVVIVRCSGCQNHHLVADNLGWFQDTPVNIETMYKDKMQKVHDPILISKFLNAAFSQDVEKSQQNQQSISLNQQKTKP